MPAMLKAGRCSAQETLLCGVEEVDASTVLPRTERTLSGLAEIPLEDHLKGVEIGRQLGFKQAIEASAMHQIGRDQSGEDKRAVDGVLCRLGET